MTTFARDEGRWMTHVFLCTWDHFLIFIYYIGVFRLLCTINDRTTKTCNHVQMVLCDLCEFKQRYFFSEKVDVQEQQAALNQFKFLS